MMKRFSILILLFIVGLVACNGDEKIISKDSAASCKTSTVNPNGSSELAMLMREMAAFTDSAKQDLMNGREIDARPEKLATIISAKKTDPNINVDVFNPLAQHYIASVEDFYGAKPEQKTEMFNNMVKACINCHENFCGGPIKRIQKLFIPIK